MEKEIAYKNKSSANHSPTLKLNVDGTLFTYREFGKKKAYQLFC